MALDKGGAIAPQPRHDAAQPGSPRTRLANPRHRCPRSAQRLLPELSFRQAQNANARTRLVQPAHEIEQLPFCPSKRKCPSDERDVHTGEVKHLSEAAPMPTAEERLWCRANFPESTVEPVRSRGRTWCGTAAVPRDIGIPRRPPLPT